VERYRVGCIGWSYDDWKGPFYPAGCPPGEYLERYSRVFDFVEVDSSFYRAPSRAMVEGWARRTPAGFRFALKLPRSITHDDRTGDGAAELAAFLRSLDPLEAAGKLGPILAQFPPEFRFPVGRGRLEAVLDGVPSERELAVELRHRSWWAEEAIALLERRRASLVWSVRPGARAPERATGPFLYARFVGDRALTRFDRVQRDGREEMERFKARFEAEELSGLRVYALVNNHYMGFGPGSAQLLRDVLGLPPLDLSGAARELGQLSLEGFGPGEDGAGEPFGG
jgi:uncharacterized protein YecE (DUF72 family)